MKKNSPSIIYLGSDHGGFRLKQLLIDFLQEHNYQVEDCGSYELDPKDDYPDYALPVAEKVKADEQSIGILLCRSGGGMVIVANKLPGIRAVEVRDQLSAEHAKQDNNANIISLGADRLTLEQAQQIVLAFLQARFAGGRHRRRLKKINKIEKKYLASKA